MVTLTGRGDNPTYIVGLGINGQKGENSYMVWGDPPHSSSDHQAYCRSFSTTSLAIVNFHCCWAKSPPKHMHKTAWSEESEPKSYLEHVEDKLEKTTATATTTKKTTTTTATQTTRRRRRRKRRTRTRTIRTTIVVIITITITIFSWKGEDMMHSIEVEGPKIYPPVPTGIPINFRSKETSFPRRRSRNRSWIWEKAGGTSEKITWVLGAWKILLKSKRADKLSASNILGSLPICANYRSCQLQGVQNWNQRYVFAFVPPCFKLSRSTWYPLFLLFVGRHLLNQVNQGRKEGRDKSPSSPHPQTLQIVPPNPCLLSHLF